MMNEVFDFIINSRKAFIKLIDDLTIEELNKIPDGYNNNIIWNFGHVVVSTQTLCYVRTGVLQDAASVKFNEYYKKDTKPTYTVTEEEVAELKVIALESIEKIKEDYASGKFSNITPFTTATYGVQMNSIEEILITTIGHDNVHQGYAWALKKLV
ncbi:DinB family protein [Pedobacter sp. ISL-68]|uniref:DinB family protein n=1 Tax=unclassified Pedobacter TaxID=2628915 RepID=UPI001BE84627|nr:MULTISPECIES: DinB family protein [unclassified Pedobacter]MBT2563723.1 DinB family protein [Pedobacter sp. ISL-64]MBT2589615.1 DinB family protein [Pedobacter sp. ISL-68]